MSLFYIRKKTIPNSYFYKKPNIIKCKELLSTENVKVLVKLSSLAEIIMKKFASTGLLIYHPNHFSLYNYVTSIPYCSISMSYYILYYESLTEIEPTLVVSSEVGDQPVHLPSLIVGSTARLKKGWIISNPVGIQL